MVGAASQGGGRFPDSHSWATSVHGPSPRHLRRGLVQLAGVGAKLGILVLTGPGLGSVRHRLSNASAPWLLAGALLELLSALSYVVIFRAVFRKRMSWRLGYEIEMSEPDRRGPTRPPPTDPDPVARPTISGSPIAQRYRAFR